MVFGYHVVNGKKADTPFYLSANNGIGVGNANATHGPHLLQVKVDEVRVITATADEHGKIAPAAGTITVPKGESKTFTITPDSGYHIKDVLVDGKSVGAVSTYTFENVVDNHTIHATFARKHTPTPSTPTVEIPDDDALGLNTTDHFAYIVGYGNGEVRPQNNITRAETMTLVNRVLNRQPETEDDLLPNMTVWTDNANPKAWYYLAVQEATNSHYYEFKTNSQYEKWTELRETRDWKAPEQ